MKVNKLLGIAAAVMLGLASACGGGGGGNDNPPLECDNAVFETTFVIDSLTIPNEDVGFDLDDENTHCDSGCINDGEGGVDNRLGAVLDGISESMGEDFNANEEIAAQIDSGDLLILFRLKDVCNFNSDGNVDLLGYIGLDADDPVDATDNFSGTEAFDVDSRGLQDPFTDIEDPLISFPGAEINRGQFHAGPSVFTLDVPISDSTLHLAIRETQVQFDFNPDPTLTGDKWLNGGMENGMLGGFVLVEDLAVALQEFAADLGDIDPATVMNIVVNQADIDFIPTGPTEETCSATDPCSVDWRTCNTSGFCVEPPNMKDAISLAIQFTGVSADFTGTIVTPAP